MSEAASGPVTGRDRISELDIIRGVALFGVLLMNLNEHSDFLFPPDRIIHIVGPTVESTVNFFTRWLAFGKAQALFSYLFGFGFALFLARAEAAGRNGTTLYLRRLSFLLVLGYAHALLIWPGDILNAYAMMGFVMVLTRRWPNWLLLAVGLPLAVLGVIALRLVFETWIVGPGQPMPWDALNEAGSLRRLPIILGADYRAFVREMWRLFWDELYSQGIGWAYLGWVLGRFMIGSWVFRQGWMQDTTAFAAGFRRWAPPLLIVGLALAAVRPTLGVLGVKPTGLAPYLATLAHTMSLVVLPFGYAAGIVVLCRNARWVRRLSGLGAVGQMALTNYLMQSLLYFFGLYGFGLGLMLYTGPTFSFLLAVAFFGLQIAFSIWWLARYRFGPAEWLWRSFTYGARQPMRKSPPPMVTAIA